MPNSPSIKTWRRTAETMLTFGLYSTVLYGSWMSLHFLALGKEKCKIEGSFKSSPGQKFQRRGVPKMEKIKGLNHLQIFVWFRFLAKITLFPRKKRLICLEQSRKSSLKSNVRRGSKIGPGQGPPSKENKKVGQKR